METVPPQPLPPPDSASTEAEAKREKEMLHKTKVIDFLGRTTPIVLQNDNGPCPLLAICNILSLRNSLNLSPDIPEVSQEKLLSLVAERLIDSNSNVEGKDSGYLENQQQNIADAIDLLPNLTTGIDVNIKFTRIDDFEFTRECTIFDLLDIPLYHGWIVDPQDHETAEAIGSKSYNTLMGELVFLDTQIIENEQKNNGDDDVDFVAATTAALGVPSPCLSRDHSFEGSPVVSRKGDIEEEAELVRVLKLSEEKSNSSPDGAVVHVGLDENACIRKSDPMEHSEAETDETVQTETVKTETLLHEDSCDLVNQHFHPKFPPAISQDLFNPISKEDNSLQLTCEESIKDDNDASQTEIAAVDGIVKPERDAQDPSSASDNLQDNIKSDETTENAPNATSFPDKSSNSENASKESDSSGLLLNAAADSDSSCGRRHHIDEAEAFSSSVDGSEPLYEGEECILDSASVAYENREPVYEGEVLLAEQVDSDSMDGSSMKSKGTISIRQGELIRNFMKSSASQLTVYGLFSLQEKVKERELCVFFRNNHFNTMFKYEGELYILVTDQGYMNQPDLVWEKLNEVNGNTQFINANFKEFKMDDDHSNSNWSEQNAMASTADYLASIDQEAGDRSSFNSDLQLAIALQQQEFEQQQHEQQQPRRNTQQQQQQQQPAITASSGLITGPQVSRSNGRYTTSSSKHDSKSKDRCIVM